MEGDTERRQERMVLTSTVTFLYGPEWRDKGLERALLLHSETRLYEISKTLGHSNDNPRLYDTFAPNSRQRRE